MMNKRKKIFICVIGITVLLLLVKVILDSYYRNQIPPLPDLQVLTTSLQDQITTASEEAHRKPTADNLGILGIVYHSSANYEKATECYKLAIKRNNSKWIWSYYLGYLNREMGEPVNAIENFKTVLKKNPKVYHAWYYIGEEYQNLGSYDEAEIAFKKICTHEEINPKPKKKFRNDYFPLETYAKYQLARLYLNSNQFEQAKNILTEIIQNHQTFGSAYRMLGNVYRILGDSLSSENCIHRANELFDFTSPIDTLIDILALRSRSELYILKQIDEAEYNFYPDWALVLVYNALNYLPDNKYLISKAIKLLLKTGSGNQTLSLLDQHTQYFHDDFEELKQVAYLLYEKGFYSESNIYYRRAIELKPDNTEIQVNLVLGLFYEDKKQQAIDLMDKYIKDFDRNPDVISNAIYVMLEMKEKEKTEYYLEKLKQLSPSNPKTLLLTGLIAEQNGNLKTAQSMYESAFKVDPEKLLSIQALGDILIRQKMWVRSIDHFRKALVSLPNEPYLLERLGTLLVTCPDTNLRKYDEGKEYLERLILHKACPPEIMVSAGINLAQTYSVLGDKQKASIFMNFIIGLPQSTSTHQELINQLEKILIKSGQ